MTVSFSRRALLHGFIYLVSKGKVKVGPVLLLTEHHAMKAHWGNGGIAPLIL
jgi:hypothetical protein